MLPAKKAGINGPGARSGHRQCRAEGSQYSGNPGIAKCEKYREIAIHTSTTAVSAPATGVHKPIRRNIPKTAPMIWSTAAANGGASINLTIPKRMSSAAVSSRKIRSPRPGQPLAKVENSRCKSLPFTR